MEQKIPSQSWGFLNALKSWPQAVIKSRIGSIKLPPSLPVQKSILLAALTLSN